MIIYYKNILYNYNAHWSRDNLPSKLGFLPRCSPPTPQSHLQSPCVLQSCTLISYQLFFLPSLTPLNSRSAACLLSHSVLKTLCYTKCQAFSCPPSQTSQCDAAKDLTARTGLPLTSLCFCSLTIDVKRNIFAFRKVR